MSDETLTAYDDERGGEVVTFTDYLPAGATPELYTEDGRWYGIRRLYQDDAGEWHVRHLTAAENAERTRRIMEQNESEARTR